MSDTLTAMARLIRQANRDETGDRVIDWFWADGFHFDVRTRKAYRGEPEPENEVPWDTAVEESPILQGYLSFKAGAP